MAKPPVAPALFVGKFVTSDMTRNDARIWASANGFEYLGGGSFAAAARDPKSGRVLRIGKADRAAEAVFALYQSPEFVDDPLATRIYGVVELADGGTAVEMECLQAGWSDKPERAIDGAYRPTFDCPLRDALTALVRTRKSGLKWDLHEQNFMLRDGDVVWTDPIYSPDDHGWRTNSGLSYSGGCICKMTPEGWGDEDDYFYA